MYALQNKEFKRIVSKNLHYALTFNIYRYNIQDEMKNMFLILKEIWFILIKILINF